jgi:hypothetical protein
MKIVVSEQARADFHRVHARKMQEAVAVAVVKVAVAVVSVVHARR